MIRAVQIPLCREEVFQALTDPIALLVWLDALGVTTGAEIFHVFEVVHNRGQVPWRIRGTVTECTPQESLAVETDAEKKRGKEVLSVRLGDTEAGCSLSVEWPGPLLDPLALGLLKPEGIARLVRSLESPAMGATHV